MAGHSQPNADFQAKLASRAKLNGQSILAFLAALLLLATVFILLHLVRLYGERPRAEASEVKKPSVLTRLSRKLRSISLRRGPGLPSVGHAGLISLYLITNIIIALTNHDNRNMSMLSNVASRMGWLAMANMVVVVILALKNTPLSFLTAYSYERLNVFHRVAGYTSITCVIIHASCYSAYFVTQSGHVDVLLRTEQIFGMVAGLSFLMLGIGGTFIRHRWYELFYYMHITFWILAIVSIGLHQSDLGSKIVIATLLAGSFWGLDRLIRLTRLVVYSTNNSVTLTPLSNGATRVTLAKAPAGALSGEHCFLWIPKIRAFETHPFTIAAVDPLEFIVQSWDGFTQDLHKYAVANPGVCLRASVEGAYGTIPDPAEYDTVVLVAGGSGASFTFGMALNMLRKLRDDESKHIVFIWAVKHSACLEWFSSHLETLGQDHRVSSKLFVTRQAMPQLIELTSESKPQHRAVINTIAMEPEKVIAYGSESQSSSMSIDSEKSVPHGKETTAERVKGGRPNYYRGIPITYARPDVAALVRAAIHETPANKRVLVLGCGPGGLMTEVRNTAAACILAEGPSVELHFEQFGW